MTGTRYDAVVVGAGHNGLVCALYLAKAGWRTLVVERNERVGGAVRSAEITRPGFVHDLYAMNQNLFLGSPFYAEFADDLARHGLSYKIAEKSYSNVYPDGTCLKVYGDQELTYRLLRKHSEDDAEGFARLHEAYRDFGASLLPVYGAPLPSAEAAWSLLKAVGSQGVERLTELLQIVASSTRELGDSYFATPEMKALIASWGLHLDFGPEVSGGAMFPFLEAFTDMENGMSVAEGGASRMPEAIAGLLREYGGEVLTSSEVTRVLVEDGRAGGVELASGERIVAERAVVANLTPRALFGRLLPTETLPYRFRDRVERYQHGPGTMMVHLALSNRPRWRADEELSEFAYVHVAPYLEDLSETYSAAVNGYLPKSPLLVVGQTSAVDASRAPGDGEVLWVQVRALPAEIRGDAVGEIEARDWEAARELYADRVMSKLEEYAPGIGDLVLERVVYSPEDLELHNPNLVGGDSLGGSHHLRQNFLFRPFPGWSNYDMPVENLYMVGAATWPGAGTNANSGYLAAQRILRPRTAYPELLKYALALGAAGAAALFARRYLRDR